MQLYNGDCLEIMKQLQDNSIDMVLCDLPYGTTRNAWDKVIDTGGLWEQYKRIVKDNGAIVLFSQAPFDKVLACSNLDMFRYEWIWVKDNITGHLNSHKMPLKIHENILVFYKKLPKYNPQKKMGKAAYSNKAVSVSSNYGKQKAFWTQSNGARFPVDVVKFARDASKLHPTQKPVSLLEYFIRTYTDAGDVVLDNCMGSGSTGVACARLKREFIGIELEKKYFLIAKERINAAL